MNSFVDDIMERISTEASRIVHYNKRHTISAREIRTAVRLSLPGALANYAISEGGKAVTKYATRKWLIKFHDTTFPPTTHPRSNTTAGDTSAQTKFCSSAYVELLLEKSPRLLQESSGMLRKSPMMLVGSPGMLQRSPVMLQESREMLVDHLRCLMHYLWY